MLFLCRSTTRDAEWITQPSLYCVLDLGLNTPSVPERVGGNLAEMEPRGRSICTKRNISVAIWARAIEAETWLSVNCYESHDAMLV